MHAITASLLADDLDRAIESGLLDSEPCASCTPGCAVAFVEARDRRRAALDARERFRARERRLAERAAQRDARRAKPAPGAAPLPAAAAAALQRALAKAKGGR